VADGEHERRREQGGHDDGAGRPRDDGPHMLDHAVDPGVVVEHVEPGFGREVESAHGLTLRPGNEITRHALHWIEQPLLPTGNDDPMTYAFAETEILVAQMTEDFERRDDLLDDLFPSELETFINQLEMVRDAAKDSIRRKGAR
jgi:hypothetical protein